MKVYESKDKPAMLGFVKLLSNASYTLRGTEIHGASQSFSWMQDLTNRLNAVCDKELGTAEDFAVTVRRLPDPPNLAPVAAPVEAPAKKKPRKR